MRSLRKIWLVSTWAVPSACDCTTWAVPSARECTRICAGGYAHQSWLWYVYILGENMRALGPHHNHPWRRPTNNSFSVATTNKPIDWGRRGFLRVSLWTFCYNRSSSFYKHRVEKCFALSFFFFLRFHIVFRRELFWSRLFSLAFCFYFLFFY